jgi:hypothetical protein
VNCGFARRAHQGDGVNGRPDRQRVRRDEGVREPGGPLVLDDR